MGNRVCALSKFHTIRLAEEYWELLDQPGKSDFTLHTISTKEALGQKTMLAELVIAGKETRAAHPLAADYPVHFKKTYMPGALHRDTSEEFAAMQKAATILESPQPIGFSDQSVRSCFIPGRTLDRLTPLLKEPQTNNAQAARKLPELQLIGLWHVLEEALSALQKLHDQDFFHRDMELHNCTVCPSPARLFLIDFGASSEREQKEDPEDLKLKDQAEILRQAIYVQCALGPQDGDLGKKSIAHLDSLFPKDAGYFRRRIEER